MSWFPVSEIATKGIHRNIKLGYIRKSDIEEDTCKAKVKVIDKYPNGFILIEIIEIVSQGKSCLIKKGEYLHVNPADRELYFSKISI